MTNTEANTEKVKLEKATLADVQGMRHCVNRAYQHYIERIGKKPGPMMDDYAVRVRDYDAYVLRLDDQVIGLLVLEITEDRCLLDNVAVDPSCFGNGYGKNLVQTAEQIARQNGFNSIELYTHELMTENILMYEKWGYVIDRYIEEKGFNRVYMRKALS